MYIEIGEEQIMSQTPRYSLRKYRTNCSHFIILAVMKYLIKNSQGVFFVGLFIALGNYIFGDYGFIFEITGFSIMSFSFLLMYLKSKQKK